MTQDFCTTKMNKQHNFKLYPKNMQRSEQQLKIQSSVTYIIRWEVLIYDFVCQLVDIFVFMILQLLNFFQTCKSKKSKITHASRTLDYDKATTQTRTLPPHSSMRLAMVSASSSAILRILLRPSRTTCTTWASFTVSRLQKGGITCFSMRCATWRGHRQVVGLTQKLWWVQTVKTKKTLKNVYLILPSTYCQVTDGPGGFFLSAKVSLKFKCSMWDAHFIRFVL